MDSAAVSPGPVARRRPRHRRYVLVAGVLSLLLSPATAVWAVVVGVPLVVVGALTARSGAGGVVLAVGAGVLLGVVPYFALAVVQAG
jgi:hypothetical protein